MKPRLMLQGCLLLPRASSLSIVLIKSLIRYLSPPCKELTLVANWASRAQISGRDRTWLALTTAKCLHRRQTLWGCPQLRAEVGIG